MSDLSVRVSGLGKRYRIGTRSRYTTLGETLVKTLRQLEVVPGDFYPTKLSPPAGYGDALLEYRWFLGPGVKDDPGQETDADSIARSAER